MRENRMVLEIADDREVNSCTLCGAVGGVWVLIEEEETEICPDCLIKIQKNEGK
jgi:NMD protein affecting ribosome stability and mRNA decay